MRSIHGVGELMTQVVLRGGGFLPVTPMAAAPEGDVKQAEPEKEDILVMDTKLKIIEILQVTLRRPAGQGRAGSAGRRDGAGASGRGREARAQLSLGGHSVPLLGSSPLHSVPWSLQLRPNPPYCPGCPWGLASMTLPSLSPGSVSAPGHVHVWLTAQSLAQGPIRFSAPACPLSLPFFIHSSTN